MVLETDRLQLIPMTIDFVDSLVHGDIEAYSPYNIRPSEEWPSDEIKGILPIIQGSLALKGGPDGFDSWIFVDRSDRSIVGDGGFKGGIDEQGRIDLGYGIVRSKRRKGYGFEAVSALLKWAFSNPAVSCITADCLDDNDASIKLLQKLGMSKYKTVDGLSYFVLRRRS